MPPDLLNTILTQYGPLGLLFIGCYFAARKILPWIQAYLERLNTALERIATVTERLEAAQKVADDKIDGLTRDFADLRMDTSHLYGYLRQPQPSRTRRSTDKPNEAST